MHYQHLRDCNQIKIKMRKAVRLILLFHLIMQVTYFSCFYYFPSIPVSLVSYICAGLLFRLSLLILLFLISVQVPCQEEDLIGRVSSGGEALLKRLRIVSEVPVSRQRTTTQTRRLVRPQQQGAGLPRQNVREFPMQLVVKRPDNSEFDVLKQAKEGVWYRRVEDEEGVALVRVKNDDVILSRDQKTKEDLRLEDKERSDGFWYRRVDDGNGGVRLVRVKNDDIIIKSLKTFKTQTTTRTRTLRAA